MDKKELFGVLLTGAAVIMLLPNASLASSKSLQDALIKDGSVYANARYRYEYVDQAGTANQANANTLRLNTGFKTGVFNDFQALVELQMVTHLGNENFNDTINGKTTYPTVADPNVAEFNQAYVTWSGLPNTKVKAGRRGVNIDNQRFIGTVGWRQDDQTFDGFTISNSSVPNLDILYGYFYNINRIFGDDSPQGDWNSASHIFNAKYKVNPALAVTGYAYLLDFKNSSAANSSETYGIRLTGKAPVNKVAQLFYTAEYAQQQDYAKNTANYDLNYIHVSGGAKVKGFTAEAGFESLAGNGTNFFRTPLATLHGQNGWADKFLTTPVNGLEDSYAKVAYKFSGINKFINGTKVAAIYHDFNAENTTTNYGNELDLLVKRNFKGSSNFLKNIGVAVKYADYNAKTLGTDTKKFWFLVSTKF